MDDLKKGGQERGAAHEAPDAEPFQLTPHEFLLNAVLSWVSVALYLVLLVLCRKSIAGEGGVLAFCLAVLALDLVNALHWTRKARRVRRENRRAG